ncbi:5568_t:CDS:10 [Entrophospora sp. SA101]|nr:5568_t:CDS:10 [Entrophospora sp. SA101]
MATLDTVRSSSPEFLGLATQFGISSAISLYCLLQFEWNRRRKSMQYLYTPRTRLIKNPSPPVPPGLFSWVKAAYRLDDKFYLTNVGLDALMYIRFLRMAFQFLLFNSLLVGPILLPINYTASASSTEERNNVDIFSVKNIKFDLNRLWAHMICTYIVSISWMYLLYKNYYSYMKLHKEYLLKKVDSGDISVRTVMISRIPEELRSEEELQKYVNRLCIGTVESARMVRHTGKLDRRIERREKALLLLERAHIQLAKNVYRFIKRRKLFGNGFWFKIFSCNKDNDVPALTVESGETREHQRIQSIIEKDGYGHQLSIWESLSRIPKSSLDKFQPKSGFFSGGKTVYAIDHFIRKFNFLDRSIAGLRSLSVTGLPYKATSTGFVTFRDHISAQMCAQSIICSTPHTCTVKMAPEPRDLLWTSPLIHTLLRNVLPTVLVSIFMAMLPWILMELSKQECFSSYSELENAVLVRYYYFSFFNVIVVFLLGKVFLESIFNILNSPASILETLANTLPQGATFFINYIVFNTCAHGFELVQVVPQIFLHILLTSRFVSTTPRILQRVTHPHSFQFYYYYPNHILILVITITYSTINPLVLPFSVLYFGIALLVFKYQFGYCYVRRYEAGGRFYKSVFRYTTDGLVVFQLTVLGVLWLNKAIAIGTLLVPLLAGTVSKDNRPKNASTTKGVITSKDTDSTMNNESSQKENFSKGDFIVNDKKEEKSISKKQLSSKDEMREKKLSSHSLSNIDEKSVDSINSKKVLLAQSINSSNNSNIDNRKIIVSEPYDSDESDIVEINNDSNSNKSNNGGSASKDSKNVIKDDNNNSNDGSANFTGENNNNPTTITLPPKNIPPKKIPANAQRLPSRGNLRCAPHPAHFTHDPSLKLIQDETSQYQTYTHPNLVKALNRKLWLPRNPFKPINIEDTVELNQALTSSDCRLSTVGYWGDNSEYLAEARVKLSKQECFSSYSELENAVLVRYYYFSFFNVIVVFLLGKVFLESIFNILNSPASILETLANTLPQGATFFINYIVFNTCAHGFELVQVVPQIFLHILLTSRFVSTTPRILQRVTHPHSFQFYYYYPNHILILVITITYSTINPLVLPFSVLYFGIALLVFKYQFGYCYVRRYEAGGRFYKSVFRYTTDGLVVFQLTVLGVLWLNKAIAIGTLLVPLLAGTVASKDTDSTMNNESSQKENFSKGDFIVNDKKEEKSISKKQLSSKDEMREKKLSSHSLSNIDEKSVDSINSKKVLLAQSINSSNNSNIDNRKIIVSEPYDSDESDIVEINNDSNSNKSNNGGSASKDSKNVIKDDNNNSNDGSANFTGENNNNPTTITLPPKNIPPKKIPANAQRLPSRGNLRCAPHPAHFTHDPSLKLIQDETSQYQTYTHPNLVKALNRKLWLPRNPFKPINIEDTVELNQALTSSDCRLSTVGYWGDNSEYLAEARVSLYGIHDFPMSPFHHRGGTGTDRRKRTESGDYCISRDVVDGVEEQNDDESSFCPYAPLSPEEEGRVSLQEFVSGELVSGELSSGEEY